MYGDSTGPPHSSLKKLPRMGGRRLLTSNLRPVIVTWSPLLPATFTET